MKFSLENVLFILMLHDSVFYSKINTRTKKKTTEKQLFEQFLKYNQTHFFSACKINMLQVAITK